MGRIDEALRRAGASTGGATLAGADRDDPFTSPWSLDDAPLSPQRAEFLADAAALVADHLLVERQPTGAADERRGAAAVANNGWRQRLAAAEVADAIHVEQFRRLAATLIHTQRARSLKVLMVTSAGPEEGKTLSALNLALALGESFRHRVLLIDADLRRPKITQLVGITDEGLSEAVKAPAERKVPLIPLTDKLTLLPAGRPDPNPLSGLTSARMQQLLNEAGATFDWVIVDTPPIGAAADASLLCAMADATLLVVRAGRTPFESVQQAIEGIGRDRIIGVVLNGVDQRQVPSSGYYFARDKHNDQR